jgi:hypothetical protein
LPLKRSADGLGVTAPGTSDNVAPHLSINTGGRYAD